MSRTKYCLCILENKRNHEELEITNKDMLPLLNKTGKKKRTRKIKKKTGNSITPKRGNAKAVKKKKNTKRFQKLFHDSIFEECNFILDFSLIKTLLTKAKEN